MSEPGLLRRANPDEAEAIQRVWEASAMADDPGGRLRGGWSATAWATDVRVLEAEASVVGVVGIRFDATAAAVPARVALALGCRTPELSDQLLGATIDLTAAAGGTRVRLWAPGTAGWVRGAAERAAFEHIRTVFHMLRPGGLPPLVASPPPRVTIRSILPAEEASVLAALNRNWADTWSFQPITAAMLERDLDGQRDGMLLAIEDGAIVATVHAVFDPDDQNPDGTPRAWISNLTVDPDHRGDGLGRVMLAAGLRHLTERGAQSITLGVDGGNPAPVQLYRTSGFEVASTIDAWDRGVGVNAIV